MNEFQSLNDLLKKYESIGIMKGGELALPPPIMLDFIGELKKFGILILGCDGWRYLKPDDPAWIVQDLSVDFSVEDEILTGEGSVVRSAELVKEFIKERANDVDLISVTFDS